VTATADGATRGPGAEAPDLDAVQRRVLRILVASQVLGGAGLGAGLTVGALLAEDVLDSTSLSGLPVALFTLGSAGAAMFVGSLSERRGRRAGLTAGYAAGAVGSAGVVLAAVLANPILLYASMLVYGSGTSTNLQARYAGGDLAAEERRGSAVSTGPGRHHVRRCSRPEPRSADGWLGHGLGHSCAGRTLPARRRPHTPPPRCS
jgi:hypothetical protein